MLRNKPAVIGMLALVALAVGCGAPPVSATSQPQPITSPTMHEMPSSPTPQAEAPPTTALTRVTDPSSVCMVNNQYMRKKQIPITVDGKTYFGCCEMCKGRLARDASARSATDPVSGARVDKASAVIGRDAQDAVFYFENEATFRRYGGT